MNSRHCDGRTERLVLGRSAQEYGLVSRALSQLSTAQRSAGRLGYSSRFVRPVDLRGKDVLDIGCGSGWFVTFAAHNGARRVVGIDLSLSSLGIAHNSLNYPGIAVARASAIQLPFRHSSIDTVVCWEVLEHVPAGAELKLLTTIRSVLRENGTLYLSTPLMSLPSTFLDPAYWLMGHRHYSVEGLRSLARRAGFESPYIEVRGGWCDILCSWDMYASKWILHRPPLLEPSLRGLVEREFGDQSGFVSIFARLRPKSI